jgi:hypothetical protein
MLLVLLLYTYVSCDYEFQFHSLRSKYIFLGHV